VKLTKDEVVLSQLGISDLFVHRVPIVHVYVATKSCGMDFFAHLFSIRVENWTDWDNHSLARANPEGPLSCRIIGCIGVM
jgi:hypothetical protein